MFKSIFVFIKAHAVATAVTTVAVAGTAIATPIAVSNYMLDKTVKQNLDMLQTSTVVTKQDENGEEVTEEVPMETVVSDEPVTFKIETVENTEYFPDGSVKSQSKEYKIVPSYNKDYSKWTKQEKEEYQKMLEEAAKMAEDTHEQWKKEDEQALKDAEAEIEKVINSYTREYNFSILSANGTITSESWQYNTAKNTYSGSVWMYEGQVTSDAFGIPAKEFKSVVYPSIKQKIGSYVTNRIKSYGDGTMPDEMKKEYEKEQQKMYAELEELVGFSK